QALALGVEVRDRDEAHAALVGERVEQLDESVQSAGGGDDADDREDIGPEILRRRRRGLDFRVRPRRAAARGGRPPRPSGPPWFSWTCATCARCQTMEINADVTLIR